MGSECGPEVTIEPLEAPEFGTAAVWLGNPQINRWLTSEWRGQPVSTRMVAVAVRNRRNRIYVIRHNNAACGLVGLSDIDLVDSTGMIWYLRGERHLSGGGVTTHAVRAAVRRSVDELGLVSIYAWIMEDNLPSRRVLEKAGFREVGRIRQAARSGDRRVDRVYFDWVHG